MKNKKIEEFYNLYMSIEKEEDLMPLLKDFTLSCTFDELLAWNQYLSMQSALFWEKVGKEGLDEDHKARLLAIHTKYDALYRHFTKDGERLKAA